MKPTEHPVRRPFPEALAQRLEGRFGKRLSRAESVRAHHGHDESHFPDAAPDAVVFVHSTDEVAEVVRACGEFDVPLIPFGVGSSLEGHILATRGGVSIDFSEMNKVLDVRAEDISASTRASPIQPSICWRFCSAITASVRCVSRRISSLSER